MTKQRTLVSFLRGPAASPVRRKLIYDACSSDAIGRSNIESIIRELDLSPTYINPSGLERPEHDDKSATCKLLKNDIPPPATSLSSGYSDSDMW